MKKSKTKPYVPTFSTRLCRARRRLQLSQRGMALLLSVPLSTYKSWEAAYYQPRTLVIAALKARLRSAHCRL